MTVEKARRAGASRGRSVHSERRENKKLDFIQNFLL
jgi:hypothetical protein